MTFTLDFQTRLPATSGNSGVRDGDPMHSRVPFDLAFGLNNLTYVSPYAGFAHWPPPDGISTTGIPKTGFDETGTAVSGNVFIAQVPTVFPADAYRFCWTLGFWHDSTSLAHDVTIQDVFVYVSSAPYTGAAYASWQGSGGATFDATKMGSPYGTSFYSTPISCPMSTQGYHLVNMSAGTAGQQTWMPFQAPSNSARALNVAWLIVAMQRNTDDGQPLTNEIIRPADFSWWVSYE